MQIVYDSRWDGSHGIGRFSIEVRKRLVHPVREIRSNGSPIGRSLLSMELEALSLSMYNQPQVFFSPGYTPAVSWSGPQVFTIHDLIHLDVPEESSQSKKFYYESVVRRQAKTSSKILTVSEYSRQRICAWLGLGADRVEVVGNGVSEDFKADGERHSPGYRYLLYVGNAKPHKNIPKMIQALALIGDADLKIVMTGRKDPAVLHHALKNGVYGQIVFTGEVSDADLAKYYRGAAAVVLPSLYEGFGMPALEGMACGVPVITSNCTSMPEVIGDAGILVNPQSVQSMSQGIKDVLENPELSMRLRQRGLSRAKLFTWDRVAQRVQVALEEAVI